MYNRKLRVSVVVHLLKKPHILHGNADCRLAVLVEGDLEGKKFGHAVMRQCTRTLEGKQMVSF